MSLLNTVIDLFMAPFRRLPPEAGLVAFAVVTGLVVLLIFKATSNPARVAQARNRALSRILEMWLYRDAPWVCLGAVGRVMGDNLRHLGVLLVPMLASLIPMALMLAQAHDWFACRPLRAGETVLVVARLKPEAAITQLDQISLDCGEADAATDGAPVHSPALREVAWRVHATGGYMPSGVLILRESTVTGALSQDPADGGDTVDRGKAGMWFIGPHAATKALATGRAPARAPACRVAGGWEWVLYPGEKRLPADSALARIEVLYPEAEYGLFGLRLGWLPAMLIVSFLAGLLVMRPLRVEF